MSDKKNTTKRLVVGSALRVLTLSDINRDPSYQREPIDRAWKRIIANFNPEALGIPVVGEREDGTLWWVDGLQRGTALKKLGHKTVRAEVFASKGPEHEAAVFRDINKFRTGLKPLQLFQAMLSAQDESAWAIKGIVEEFGFVIPPSTKAGPASKSAEILAKQLGSINCIQKVYKHGGADALRFVMTVISKCWPDDTQRTRDTILYGLYVFWLRKNKNVDMDRLVPRLNTTTPGKIIYSAGAMAGSYEANAGDVIEKLYKKRLSGRERIN